MVRRASFQVTWRMMQATRMAAMGSASSSCGDVPVLAGVGCGEAEEDGERRPDVGAEVDGVGFEGFAIGLGWRCDGVCASG